MPSFLQTLDLHSFIVWLMRITNVFFNEQIRDSESTIIQFVWTASVLFGWVKLIFETKNLLEFFIRHLVWGVWWKRQLNYTN